MTRLVGSLVACDDGYNSHECSYAENSDTLGCLATRGSTALVFENVAREVAVVRTGPLFYGQLLSFPDSYGSWDIVEHRAALQKPKLRREELRARFAGSMIAEGTGGLEEHPNVVNSIWLPQRACGLGGLLLRCHGGSTRWVKF